MTTLKDTIKKMLEEIEGTGIEINFSEAGIQIHWNGVNQIDCTVENAARAIGHIKALEQLGMKSC
jgi:hypothetical protein